VYQFAELVNHGLFFRFDKKWVENMNWALLPKSSKGILPVIACHCNESGESFPGEQTIAALSGWTDKKVREGINGLVGFPGFEVAYYVTKRGRRAKRYKMTFPPEHEKGRSFFFHKIILDGGNWRELRPVSQALYPVMRYFGYFDQDIYFGQEDSEENSFGPDEFDLMFKSRKWDLCEAEVSTMADYAGIKRPSVYTALTDLEKNFLIKDAGTNDEGARWWRVYLTPPSYWNRAYLNKKIIRQAYKNDV
jgi:hypothetical protein